MSLFFFLFISKKFWAIGDPGGRAVATPPRGQRARRDDDADGGDGLPDHPDAVRLLARSAADVLRVAAAGQRPAGAERRRLSVMDHAPAGR